MTDPVVPTPSGGTVPPQAGGAYPPPAFPPAGEPVQPGTEEPKKKSGVKKKVLSVLAAILIFGIVLVVKAGLGSLLAKDPTGDAKAGSCIELKSDLGDAATEVEAETADCAKSEAKYSVIARVDGVSDVNGTACDTSFEAKLKEGQKGYVIGSTEGDGYLLCMTDKA